MNTLNFTKMRRLRVLSFFLILFFFITGTAHAQYSATIGSGTTQTTSTGNDPINGYYNYQHYQVVYTAAELTAAGMGPGVSISALGWSVSGDYGGGALNNYTVRMAHTSATNSASHDASALSQVVNPFGYDPTVVPAGSFDMITFDSVFMWDGVNNLLVDICTGSNPFTSPYGQVRTMASSTTNGSRSLECDGCGSQCSVNTSSTNSNKPQVRFTFTPTLACSLTPVGGTAIIAVAPSCGQDFTIKVTGSSETSVSGLSFQWQDSTAGGSWSNIGIDTPVYIAATSSLSGATYIRRNITCVSSSLTSSSDPVLVVPIVGGTSSATAPVCGDSITLSLSGNTAGSGITFQWEESTDSINWSAIPSATFASQKIPTPTVITFYRSQVTCGLSASSIPVRVIPLKAGNTVITSSVCNDSTLLSLSGASTGSLTYQWLSSTDSITWAPVGGASSASYKFASPTTITYYRNLLTCGLNTDTSVAVKVVEPCQGFRYSIARNTGVTFTSIQTTGTAFTWAGTSGDDDRTIPVIFPAGFNFTYNGQSVTAFYACTNGWMSFDTTSFSTAYSNDLSSNSPKYIIAPFWEDLVTMGNSATNRSYIKYEFSGTAPNRILTVEWAEMERFQYGSPSLNFQAKFYEGTSNIEYVYGRMQPFDGNGTGDFSYSIGMTGASSSGAGQRFSLALENTTDFRSATVFNNNTIVPACNSSYLFTAGGTFVATTSSAIPSNDSSSTPVVLTVNPIPCTDGCGTYYSSRGATASSTAIAPVSGNPDDDVWFRFTAPVSGHVNISTFSSSGYDPAFQVMTTTFDTAGMGTAGSVNANSNAIENAVVNTLTPGTDYLIRMFNAGSGSGSTSGAFSICVNEVIPAPANDDTTGAVLITAAPACTPIAGTTLGSTASTVPVCGGLADDDVWYKFIPNNSIDTVTVQGSGTFRAHVQVLSSSLASLYCQNTGTNGGTVSITATGLLKDSTYFVRVYHTNAGTATANFTICVSGNNATAPVVNTGSATLVVDNIATVSGSIAGSGGFPVVTSGIVFSTTPAPVIGDPGVVDSTTTPLVANGSFSFNLTGLSPSTTYYFRTYAINNIGTAYGPDSSFTTTSGPLAPSVAKVAADQIGTTVARVGGDILSNGNATITASGVIYGLSSSTLALGDPSVVDSTTNPPVTSGGFNFIIAGLTHSTKYYFRSYAVNAAGNGYSDIDSFVTQPIISTLPYNQDFESGANAWTVTTELGYTNDWVLGTPAKTFLSGAHSGTNAWVTNLTGVYDNAVQSSVVSPQFDFTAAAGDPVLRFYHRFSTEQTWDGMIVQISINGGAWTKLDPTVGTGSNYNTAGSYSWYNNTSTNGPVAPPKFSSVNSGEGTDILYSSQNNGWIQSATILTGAAGQADVRVRFFFGSDGSGQYEGFALDDIQIQDVITPSTPASAVVTSNITDTTTDVSWTNGDGEGRMVVAHLTTDPAVAPMDNTLYETSSSAFGRSDSTGLGNYIVFNGVPSTVSVGGLTMLTDYTYDVYEFNGKYMHIRFSTAASTNATTLPVTFTSFTGTAKAADALLSWITASEINNKGFEVERSVDGRSFESVGFVKGAGNSNHELNYTLTDAKAFAKTNSTALYYRLKQVDFDGRFTYSNIVRINSSAQKANALSVYPNPFNNNYNVSFNAATAGVVDLKMTDVQGRVVAEHSANVLKGENKIAFDNLNNLQTGIYFVKITVDGETQVLRLVKN